MACTDRSRPPTGMPTSCRFRSSAHPRGSSASTLLGRSEDPRQVDSPVPDDQAAGGQHDSRRARSQGLVKRRKRRRYKARGTRTRRRARAQRSVVRRLQGRVHARQQAVLLPAHDHRLPLPLPARLRGALVDALRVRLLRVRARLQGLSACPVPSAPTTARRSLPTRPCSDSPGSRSGGCALGIQIQRIKPGHPQQNGRHERMHLTLKKEATKPASFNFLQQQERFDDFIGVYNHERPHQALGGAYPADLYTPSARPTTQPPRSPSTPITTAPCA